MKWLMYILGSTLALLIVFSGSHGEMSVNAEGDSATFAVK